MTISRPSTVIVLAILALSAASCSGGTTRAVGPREVTALGDAAAEEASFDIVDTATAVGTFDTLLSAAEAAGLIEELRRPGPYTLFAPTDEAFATLPPEMLERLLDPGHREELRALIRTHLVPRALSYDEILAARSAVNVEGRGLEFRFRRGAVRVGSARIVRGDIDCSNGVIHAIDAVLLPSS